VVLSRAGAEGTLPLASVSALDSNPDAASINRSHSQLETRALSVGRDRQFVGNSRNRGDRSVAYKQDYGARSLPFAFLTEEFVNPVFHA